MWGNAELFDRDELPKEIVWTAHKYGLPLGKVDTKTLMLSDSGYYCSPYIPEYFEENEVKELLYRGKLVRVYMDDPGQQYYAVIDNLKYYFGAYNFNYIDDIFYIIDNMIDIIYKFEGKFFGAQLKFVKKETSRDLILTYRLREIKVFLVPDDYKPTEDDKKMLIEESEKALEKYLAEKDLNKIICL